jgi:hypothetical protein
MAFGHHVQRAKREKMAASRDTLEQFMLEQMARIKTNMSTRRHPAFNEEIYTPYPDLRECNVTRLK